MNILTKIKNKFSSFFYPQTNIQEVQDLVNCNDLQHKFTKVYEDNLFEGKHSRSGEGSDFVQTEVIRSEIPKLIKKYDIKSMVDAPCGDWFWMQSVDLGVEKYIGLDIVEKMINSHNKTYGNDIVSFECINLTQGSIPKADLIFSRDCLVHLGYQDIKAILKNFKDSGSKYLLTTTFTKRTSNTDLDELFWRPLNMQMMPFNFPDPLMLINENCTEDNSNFSDKCLGLWLLDDIKV